jgi:unsaturated rhamnogalacturonyl hydrolase
MQKQDIEGMIQKIMGRMQRVGVASPEDASMNIHASEQWDWSQGVRLRSLYLYYKETRDQDIFQYLTDWFDNQIREELPPKNINTMCPLLTLSYIYEETHHPEYLRICEEWASYAADEMPRTPEFGITYAMNDNLGENDNDNEKELWDDTLYMTVLFMGRMGILLNNDYYVQESVRQFLVHLKYLTDRKTGLFFHSWTFGEHHHYAEALWGRGNAWYMAGLVDYLDMMKIPMGVELYLLSSLERQIQKLTELQMPSGLWTTLLDDPTSYEETSATAVFAYSILKAVRKGYISEVYKEVGLKALGAVIDKIDANGAVQGVSYLTRVGCTLQSYKDIAVCPMPYGQSMTLLMLVEGLQHVE